MVANLKCSGFLPCIFYAIHIVRPLLAPYGEVRSIAPTGAHIKARIRCIISHPTPAKIANTVLRVQIKRYPFSISHSPYTQAGAT